MYNDVDVVAVLLLYLMFVAVRVAESMQQEVTAKRGELDAVQNKLVANPAVVQPASNY